MTMTDDSATAAWPDEGFAPPLSPAGAAPQGQPFGFTDVSAGSADQSSLSPADLGDIQALGYQNWSALNQLLRPASATPPPLVPSTGDPDRDALVAALKQASGAPGGPASDVDAGDAASANSSGTAPSAARLYRASWLAGPAGDGQTWQAGYSGGVGLDSRGTKLGQAPRPVTGSPTGGHAPPNKVDWSFISTSEGGLKTSGYIPPRAAQTHDNSGITVGDGVDLGSVSANDLSNWGASPALIAKLRPYLQVQGDNARKFLNNPNDVGSGLKTPLTISQSDAELLTAGAKSRALGDLAAMYRSATGRDFTSLSPAKQTVLADVAFQTGLKGLQHHFANGAFWDAVKSGDWSSAARVLATMPTDYRSRRLRERLLLERDLSQGSH